MSHIVSGHGSDSMFEYISRWSQTVIILIPKPILYAARWSV